MGSEFWAVIFPRWDIAVVEVVMGLLMMAIPGRIADPARSFRHEIKDPVLGPRYLTVLQRRKQIEAMPALPWRLNGGISIAIGVATALAIASPVVSYALFCLSLSIVVTFVFMTMRNRSDRRAASLSPRGATTSLPLWIYLVTACAGLTPLVFVTVSDLSLSAVLVALVSVLLVASSWGVGGMAAMLTGEDPEIEMAVEDRLRCNRVSGLLIIAPALPFVFFRIALPIGMRLTLEQAVAYGLCAAMLLLTYAWFVSRVLRRPRGLERIAEL